MSLNVTAVAKAQKFLGTTEPLVRLGWGIGGFVFLSSDGRSAVKIFKEPGGFQTELRAYLVLKRAGIPKLHGLNVPTLKGK